MFRVGKGNGNFYPNVSSDFDMSECPAFWRNHKVKINLLNMKDEDYMDNIRISAFIAIGMDLLVGIGSFLFIWNCSYMPTVYKNRKDKLGPFTLFAGFGRFKFFITKILIGFGLPLVDTVLGKRFF